MIITGGWTELPIHSFPYTVPSVNGCRCIFYRKNIFANSCDRARENGDLFFFFFFSSTWNVSFFFFWHYWTLKMFFDGYLIRWMIFGLSTFFAFISRFYLPVELFISFYFLIRIYIYFFFFYSWNIIMIETCRCCWKQLSQSRKQNWSVWSETEMGNFSFPTNETKR